MTSEDFSTDTSSASNPKQLSLSTPSKNYLLEAAKWARFLAILGFIGIGIMAVVGIFASSIMSFASNASGMNFPFSGVFSFYFLVVIALYFFPILYLYQFSTRVKRAIVQGDGFELEKSFEYLKSHYKFIGIVTLIFLVIYFGFMLIGFFAAAAFI